MKQLILGVLAAAFVHLVILVFGGILFLGLRDESKKLSVEEVDVVDVPEEAKKLEDLEKRKAEDVEAPRDKPPDMQQLVEIEHELPTLSDATPELSALSLAALESALDPTGSGGEAFGSAFNLTSGGRIGGTGTPGGDESSQENLSFGLEDLDQVARPVFQSAPSYPADLRQRKVEGVVTVLFVVDPDGRVIEPKVEGSTDPGFDAPALDAVRRWKFEPAVRNGKKVPSKIRIPIRFSLNS